MHELRATERPREKERGDFELWHEVARAKILSYALKHRHSGKALRSLAFKDEHFLLLTVVPHLLN